mgnify:CR=1 FL=1
MISRQGRWLLRLGALESSTASRLPPLFVAFHRELPEVRIELITGTNDALLGALLDRRIEAAFMAEAPAHAELSHQPLFAERLTLITALDHKPVRRTADVAGDSVIAFPQGCAYRRVLERWLGAETLASVRVMELGSYHAIVACVAAAVLSICAPVAAKNASSSGSATVPRSRGGSGRR